MCDGCLDREIVAGISIEIIRPCLENIEKSSKLIPDLEKNWKKSAFILKNLYYLLERIKTFNIELISHEEGLDFSYTKESIIGLIYGPKKLKEYNWIGFIGATLPKVQQSQRDLKKDLIKRFDEALVLFTNICISLVIPQIIRFLMLCEQEPNNENLKKQLHGISIEKPIPNFTLPDIKSQMEVLSKNLEQNLADALQKIVFAFLGGEFYAKLRTEIINSITQEITKNIQKWYDILAQLIEPGEYESLNMPNIKIVYEIINKINAKL